MASKTIKRLVVIGVSVALIVSVLFITLMPSGISVRASGLLSFTSTLNTTAIKDVTKESIRQPVLPSTIINTETWGYTFILENGDVVEIGDSSTTDFKAHVKTTRWNGVADFSLWLAGGTFIPTLIGETVTFDFNSSIAVEIYPTNPDYQHSENGIEYNVILLKKPAKPTVTLNFASTNIRWTKILPLDVEYDQTACIEEWGIELSPFIITPLSITSQATSEVLLTRNYYEINSYIGEVTAPYHTKTMQEPNGLSYSTVSRSYLHIQRGEMTDALGSSALVEDIILDEVAGTIDFVLPKEWLRTAEYPVYHSCGVDPAYTEDMDNWDSSTYGSDGTWSDYDLYTNHGVPKGAVAEIIMSNQEAGVEALTGIRTDGSSVIRTVQLHEAEGGGVTTCRMFVVCHATTGLIETYSEDISDANLFYLVGYWENVTFTESRTGYNIGEAGSWVEVSTMPVADRVYHFVLIVGTYTNGQNYANTMGVRTGGSSLERKILIHESESDGSSVMDMMVKSNGTSVELYGDPEYYIEAGFDNMGYFGEELDFVEGWQQVTGLYSTWEIEDLSAYLDEDGRVVDMLLLNCDTANERHIGVRDGDDTTTDRYITEHEAEDDGGATGEYTGFGMSATTNSSGEIYIYGHFSNTVISYFTGYFKSAVAGADISNSPSSKAFGVVQANTTYWSNGSEPSWVLTDGDAYFTITNNGATCSITIKATNFTGGVGWTLTSGSPAENTVRMTAFKEGDDFDEGITLTTSPQSFITALGASADIDWELKLETGTPTDGALKTSTITLDATLD